MVGSEVGGRPCYQRSRIELPGQCSAILTSFRALFPIRVNIHANVTGKYPQVDIGSRTREEVGAMLRSKTLCQSTNCQCMSAYVPLDSQFMASQRCNLMCWIDAVSQ